MSVPQESKGNAANGHAAYASSQVVATSAPQLRGKVFEEASRKGIPQQEAAKAAAAVPLQPEQ